MTEGSIVKSLLLFALPLIFGNLLQQMYNTADSIIVGNFVGSNALAAVGSSGSPIYLLIGFSQGLAVGAGVVVSQYLGAGDHKETREAVHTSLAIAVVMGLLLTVGGVACGRALLVAMNTPAEVLADAVTYIRIYFGGVLFSVVYNMTAGILNAAGNSRRSLVYLAWASVTNIVLDFVFIVGLRMGVAGAAIATDLSQLVSCVLSLRFLMKSEDACRVELSAIRLHRKMAGRIIRVGLPTGIQNMVISFSNVLVQASVNSYGAAAMAGFAAYMKIDGFNILPVSSISMAATTFVGQNYGAGRLDRVKRSVWVTLAIGVIYTLCTGAALLAGQDAILHLFTADEAVVTYGKLAMRWFCPFYFLLSILHGLAGAVRGTGASIPPMVVLLVSLCLFRVVWIQFLLPFFSGIAGNLNTNLHINDVVLGGTLRYLDTDMRLVGQFKPGTADRPIEEYHSDDRLLELADQALNDLNIHHIVGIIATGNYFVDDPQKVEQVIRETGADAVEMEGAAVAHVAARNDVPALVIRALSDNADTDYEDFKTFDISEYADTAAKLTVNIAKRM